MTPQTNSNPRSLSRFGLILLVLTTITLGTLGGSLFGGIAGYLFAINQPSTVLTLPEPETISASSPNLVPAGSALSPVSRGSAAVVTENEALIAAVDTVKPATVTILNQVGNRVAGSGSGVIIDKAGYIITNHHVVQGARELEVIFSHGGGVPAQFIGSSAEFDLAILKIDASQVPAFAAFGDSSALRQGERVVAIGSALGGFRNTVTSGVISAHNRSLGEQDGLLQTDAAINHGNSGGPLVNLQGEIIGINVMILRGNIGGDITEGLGFSIPSNTAKMVARQLIDTGRVQLPYLGISYVELNPQLSMEYDLSVGTGSFISDVESGTAAAKAGLVSGDVITAVDGQKVDDAHPLRQLLLQHDVGDEVVLTIVRGNTELEQRVTLGRR